MAIDPSIALGVQPFKAPDQMNMLAQIMQIQGAQNQNQLAQYSLGKARRQDEESNALAGLVRDGVDFTTPEGQAKLYGAAPLSAEGFMKGRLETKNLQTTIAKNEQETIDKAVIRHRDQLANVNTPQDAVAWVQAQHADPLVGKVVSRMGTVEQAVASIPTDPAAFQEWKLKNALGMTEFAKQNKPTIHEQDNGQVKQLLAIPGLGGAPSVVSSVQKQATPDAVMTDQRARSEGALNRGQALKLHNDTVANENLRAGVGPGGALDENTERTAQAIAKGQLPAPTGMALLNPKNQRILGRVMEINPEYDASTVGAKQKAARDFTSGQLGNALRSVSTANAHLDQLGELADALQNGNSQVANKVTNYFSKITGNPAVTNFDAIKAIVGQEVVKAIVAGGGGVGEREEAAKMFSSASSPAQLKGVIQHYRMVMGAQASNLMEQRRAAGLPDSTLPDYNKANPEPSSAAAVPPDIAAILQKHGKGK